MGFPIPAALYVMLVISNEYVQCDFSPFSISFKEVLNVLGVLLTLGPIWKRMTAISGPLCMLPVLGSIWTVSKCCSMQVSWYLYLHCSVQVPLVSTCPPQGRWILFTCTVHCGELGGGVRWTTCEACSPACWLIPWASVSISIKQEI